MLLAWYSPCLSILSQHPSAPSTHIHIPGFGQVLSAPIPAHCVLGNERLEVAGTLGHDLNCGLQQKGNSNVSMLWVRKRRTRDGKVESKEGKGWGWA